ncbi:MAG: ATP-dependent zinc protease [Sphingomonadales bacterium]|nr:ATP-dependent zinc protease [Sphingomonadales bacterium]MBD3773367.1 ATP-dependent zinc protease [Paracoccaceae bacterium]
MGDSNGILPLVGWREAVGLPELGLVGLAAKIDTGAQTSSLHALAAECFERDGQEWVRFLLDLGEGHAPRECIAPHVEHRSITSSNGVSEQRLVVKTRLVIGEFAFRTEFSLADRSDMKYPMLVGRMALRRRFLVDPGRSWLLTQKPENQ